MLRDKILRSCDKIVSFGLVVFALGMGFSISVTTVGFYLFVFIPFIIKLFLGGEKYFFSTKILIYPLLLYFLAGFVSIFFAYNPQLALFTLSKNITKFIPLLILPLVIKSIDKYINLFILTLISGSLNGLYGIYQYFFQQLPRAGGTSFYMTLGGILMSLGIVSYYMLIQKIKLKKIIPILLYLIFFMVITLSLIYTFTRNAWLGFFAGILILTFILPKTGIPIPSILSFAVILPLFFYTPFRTRLISSFSPHHPVNAERMVMWKAALVHLPSYWLTGIGVGNASDFFQRNSIPVNTRDHLHNNFLEIILESGILGLVSFLFLLYLIFYRALKLIYAPFYDKITYLVIALTLSFIIAGMFEFNFGDTEVVTPVLYWWSSLFVNSSHS